MSELVDQATEEALREEDIDPVPGLFLGEWPREMTVGEVAFIDIEIQPNPLFTPRGGESEGALVQVEETGRLKVLTAPIFVQVGESVIELSVEGGAITPPAVMQPMRLVRGLPTAFRWAIRGVKQGTAVLTISTEAMWLANPSLDLEDINPEDLALATPWEYNFKIDVIPPPAGPDVTEGDSDGSSTSANASTTSSTADPTTATTSGDESAALVGETEPGPLQRLLDALATFETIVGIGVAGGLGAIVRWVRRHPRLTADYESWEQHDGETITLVTLANQGTHPAKNLRITVDPGGHADHFEELAHEASETLHVVTPHSPPNSSALVLRITAVYDYDRFQGRRHVRDHRTALNVRVVHSEAKQSG